MLKPCQGPTRVVPSLPAPPSRIRVVPGSPLIPREPMPPRAGTDRWGWGPDAFAHRLRWHSAGAAAAAEPGSPPTLPNCSEQTPAWSHGQILVEAHSHRAGTEGQAPPGRAAGSHSQLYGTGNQHWASQPPQTPVRGAPRGAGSQSTVIAKEAFIQQHLGTAGGFITNPSSH